MDSAHAWIRTIIVLMAIPTSFVIAIKTQNIQTILFMIGFLYAVLSSGYLIFILRDEDVSILNVIKSESLILRRWSTWMLILYMATINILITETFFIDLGSLILVYMGGILDQITLHWVAERI